MSLYKNIWFIIRDRSINICLDYDYILIIVAVVVVKKNIFHHPPT